MWWYDKEKEKRYLEAKTNNKSLKQGTVEVQPWDDMGEQRLPDDDRTARIVGAIIAMARELGMTLTAEGIETEAQHQFLLDAGCEVGQGFGFARPQPAEAIERFLF